MVCGNMTCCNIRQHWSTLHTFVCLFFSCVYRLSDLWKSDSFWKKVFLVKMHNPDNIMYCSWIYQCNRFALFLLIINKIYCGLTSHLWFSECLMGYHCPANLLWPAVGTQHHRTAKGVLHIWTMPIPIRALSYPKVTLTSLSEVHIQLYMVYS